MVLAISCQSSFSSHKRSGVRIAGGARPTLPAPSYVDSAASPSVALPSDASDAWLALSTLDVHWRSVSCLVIVPVVSGRRCRTQARHTLHDSSFGSSGSFTDNSDQPPGVVAVLDDVGNRTGKYHPRHLVGLVPGHGAECFSVARRIHPPGQRAPRFERFRCCAHCAAARAKVRGLRACSFCLAPPINLSRNNRSTHCSLCRLPTPRVVFTFLGTGTKLLLCLLRSQMFL